MLKRKDVVEKLAERGYTKKAADIAVGDILEIITEAMADGEDVQFYGFGTFIVREVADKNALDLQTHEMIVIPGHKVPRFAPGTNLRRCVREGVVREQ